MGRRHADRTLGDLVARPQSLPQTGYLRICGRSPRTVFDAYAIGDSPDASGNAGEDVIRADVLRDALIRYALLHPHEKPDIRLRYFEFYLLHRDSIARISLPARIGYGAACFDAFAESAGIRDEGVETISSILWSFVIPERRTSWEETAKFQIPPTHEGFRSLFGEEHPDPVIASLEEIVDWVVDAGSSAIEHGAGDFGSIAATIGAMHVVERYGMGRPALAPFEASAVTEADGWEREVSIHLRERALGVSPFRG